MQKSSSDRVRVWDLPTRVFHWALALCLVGSVASANIGGNAMVFHFRFGYAVLTLLLFRLVWGVVGGHWSRFVSFIPSPMAAWRYVTGRGSDAVIGHSPLGALAVFAMLLVIGLQVGSGLMSDDAIAFSGPLASLVSNAWVSTATNYHAHIGKFLLIGLVVLHLLAIAFYAWHGRGLVGAMVHGDRVVIAGNPASLPVKTVLISSRDDLLARLAALALLALCAGVAYWVSTLGAPAF